MLHITPCPHQGTTPPLELSPLWGEATRDGVGTISPTTKLYAVNDDAVIVGMFGVIWYRDSCKFKNGFIMAAYRGRGYYRQVLAHRIAMARRRGLSRINATCTDMSVNLYMKFGAVILREFTVGAKRVHLTDVRIIL